MKSHAVTELIKPRAPETGKNKEQNCEEGISNEDCGVHFQYSFYSPLHPPVISFLSPVTYAGTAETSNAATSKAGSCNIEGLGVLLRVVRL